MEPVPIVFTHKGKEYTGTFTSVSGTAGSGYDHWHLIIDNIYHGSLHYSQFLNAWVFTSNSGKFDELSSYFEGFMVGWFG